MLNWTNPVTNTTEPDDNDDDGETTREVHGMTLKKYYHSPVADIEGVIKVRLGRTVDDVEEGVFIILWESTDHLKSFLESPVLTETFLRGLGILPQDDWPAASHFTTLQYGAGFSIGVRDVDPDGLEGRISLTTMDIPYLASQGQDREGWRRILKEGPGSLTSIKEYRFPFGNFRCPQYFTSSNALTYFVEPVDEAKLDPTSPATREREEGREIETAICYLFQRWNLGGQMREKEDALFREPSGEERIAEAISKALPLVQSWRTERWDVETAPCCLELCGSLDEDEAGLPPPMRDDEDVVSMTCRLRKMQ